MAVVIRGTIHGRVCLMAVPDTWMIHAGAACDAVGVHLRPAAILIRQGRIAEIGAPGELGGARGAQGPVLDLSDRLVLPALVNGHAHLDLTGLGPRPFGGQFVDWLRSIVRSRPQDAKDIAEAVRQGVSGSRAAGVGYIADIAHCRTAAQTRQQLGILGLPGVSYLECVGIGAAAEEAASELSDRLGGLAFEAAVPAHSRGVILGLGPHAPYAAGEALYAAATRLGRHHAVRLSTHLAESPQEIQFVREASGPLADLLVDLGKWDPQIQPTGKHPVEWMQPHLRRARWLLAHCNYVEDSHLKILARCDASVAYCPIASAYFGHEHHRYRDMLAAGINVCLGTDSIVCQDPLDPQPLGILGQMRFLFNRDGTDPNILLSMATVNGIKAMAIDERFARLSEGSPADLVSVRFDPADRTEPLEQALRSEELIHPIEGPVAAE